jgi:hypothetical protein
MTISFPYRHPDNCCCSLHLHHDLVVHPPQFLRQLPVRESVHEFATERNNSIKQPSRNTHPCRRRPRIRRSRRAPFPIFVAASRPISSEIESPPQISTSPLPEQPTDLVLAGRQRARSTGLSPPGRMLRCDRGSRRALLRWGPCGTLTVAPRAFVLPTATRRVDVNIFQYQIESLLDVTVVGRSPPPRPLGVRHPKQRRDLAPVSAGVAAHAGDNLQSAHHTCRQYRWDTDGPIPPKTSDQTTPFQRSQRRGGGARLTAMEGKRSMATVVLDDGGRRPAAVLFDDGGGNKQQQQWRRMEYQAVRPPQ